MKTTKQDDTIFTHEDVVPYGGDLPTMFFHYRGKRWKIRILTGVLIVNGERYCSFTNEDTLTIDITERHATAAGIREALGIINLYADDNSPPAGSRQPGQA